MAKKAKTRRVHDEDFKREAVQMLLDGHSAKSVPPPSPRTDRTH